MQDFLLHINKLTKSDWNKLFDLKDEIKSTKKFGEFKGGDKLPNGDLQMPYFAWADITIRLFNIVKELNIAPKFDWTNWIEGKEIINNKELDYNCLEIETLCKLFTLIIRNDRFNDGFLVHNLQNGTIFKIIKALEFKISNK